MPSGYVYASNVNVEKNGLKMHKASVPQVRSMYLDIM